MPVPRVSDNFTRVKTIDLKPGMVMRTWFGDWQISAVAKKPNPVYDFVFGSVSFHGTNLAMSLSKNDSHDVSCESIKLVARLGP